MEDEIVHQLYLNLMGTQTKLIYADFLAFHQSRVELPELAPDQLQVERRTQFVQQNALVQFNQPVGTAQRNVQPQVLCANGTQPFLVGAKCSGELDGHWGSH